jgi:twitching motility two-component system response regulator PilG
MAHEPPVVEPAFGDPAPDSPTAWPAVEAAAEPAAVVEAAAATEPSAPESYESHSTPEPEHAPAAPAEAAPESNVPAIAAPEMNAAPAPETDQTAAAAPPAQPPASESTSTGSGRRTVMVVDDSPTIRKILGLTLERAGYKVVAEPDGESAIERLEQIVPDLILLDIAMPKIDGYEVCKRIKKDPRTAGVPVVMLSGKDAFFDKVKGHMAGATEYLTKPFETPAVLAVVTTHCQPPSEALHG